MNKSFIRYTLLSVIGLEGIAIIISAIVGFFYKESQAFIFLICGLVYLLLGTINFRNKPKNNMFFAKDGFVMCALSWIFMSLCGAIPMVLSKDIPFFVDAFFEIVSGFTTTGSTILTNVEGLSRTAMFWRLFTHWFGGMGILVFVMAILPMGGGYGIHILKAESPGPVVGKLVPKLSSTAKILYGIYSGMTFIEVILLLICKMPLYESVTLSFATAGTGGFGLLADGFASYSSAVQIIVGIFMLLFGINFNVYYFILIGKAKEALKSEELRWYLCIVAIAVCLITVNTMNLEIYSGFLDTLKHSFFQVSSIITTTGFATVDFNEYWPTFSKIIIVALMFCGACAGSTGGGFKVSRVVMLLKDAKNRLLRNISPRNVRNVHFEGKPVDKDVIESTKSYLCIYVLVFIVSLLIIGLDSSFNFTECFTAVTATINNIGPGLGKIGPMGGFSDFSVLSKLILSFDMLAGRLELIPMLILFSPNTYKRKKI